VDWNTEWLPRTVTPTSSTTPAQHTRADRVRATWYQDTKADSKISTACPSTLCALSFVQQGHCNACLAPLQLMCLACSGTPRRPSGAQSSREHEEYRPRMGGCCHRPIVVTVVWDWWLAVGELKFSPRALPRHKRSEPTARPISATCATPMVKEKKAPAMAARDDRCFAVV
jgi:hypothetical protein